MIIDELLVSLGFDYDEEGLEAFKSDLEEARSFATKLFSTLAAGTAALVGFAIATTSASDGQGKLADEIGIAVESLDALQYASQRAGGTSDGLNASLSQLSIRIAETARGVGSGVEAFGILGLNVRTATGELKSADNMLLEVSDRFQSLSKSQQIELADKLGIRDSIRLLQQGSNGIRQLTDDAMALGVTTQEDAYISAEFQDSITSIWQIVKQLSRVITRSLLPVMQDTAKSFTDWWVANRGLIEQNLPEYIDKATIAIKLLTFAAMGFLAVKLVNTLVSLITLMRGLTVATMAMNAATLLLPTLIAAGIAAIALLAEDANVFFKGGDSFIGSMIKKFPQWETRILAVAKVFRIVYDIVAAILSALGAAFDIVSRLIMGDWEGVLKDLKTAVDEVISYLSGAIGNFFSSIGKAISNIGKDLKDKISGAFSVDILPEFVRKYITDDESESTPTDNKVNISPVVKGFIGNLTPDNNLINPFANTYQPFSQSDTNTTNNTSKQVNFQGGITIEVNEAQSGGNTAEQVRRELESMIEQADNDMNSAVRL